MAQLLRNAGPFSDVDGNLHLVDDDMLAKLLYSHTLPFLRRAVIVYFASTGTYVQPDAAFPSTTSEYSKLLTLLDLPHPVKTLSNPAATETPIVARWLTQWAMAGRLVPHLEFPGTYELARVPRLYEDMVLKFANAKCSRCETRPMFPAMCLNCGKFVCLGGDCCAEGEQGECNVHMRE
jgi:E3 ubiquitin-protein ligase UBR1